MKSLCNKAAILWEFWRTRSVLKSLKTRGDVLKHQKRLLAFQLNRLARTIPFYKAFLGKPLQDWPVIDKAQLMAHFAELNSAGVKKEQAWQVAETALALHNGSGKIRGITVGTSTGTSGNRGLFLVSEAERIRWLGSILARTLPDFPWNKHRVALMLSTGNELYETTVASGRLAFAFFDLRQGVEVHLAKLEVFAPDVLIAPPKALRLIAESAHRLPLKHVFSGGEVLDEMDIPVIAAVLGKRPRPIYQATEGFLGVACEAGTIHLNEDSMLFELEAVEATSNRVTPIITDLQRSTQGIVRYRLNDLLVLEEEGKSCPCGSPLQAVKKIEGRCDDILKFRAQGTSKVVNMMPDAIRNVILDVHRSIDDFRVIQTGPNTLEIYLPEHCKPWGALVEKAVQESVCGAGAEAPQTHVKFGIEIPFQTKLRRVERRWRDEPS